MIDFIRENWAIIVAVISELMAFLPAKFNGIAQTAVKILGFIFGSKKKEPVTK